ncbi:fatty acid desaturase, putative [Bodo saltans]|uniref:Fatty acid desaturase, putative n=1 Tax=Bodo saltans TaxID=75058 RepID=A0A0S4JFH4_BODSA|nr:fatty acid desaturase, putative [Bodo saltans]|eukprot:CUG88868.1 fatty acid desaturase, putative [Bodo saltans]
MSDTIATNDASVRAEAYKRHKSLVPADALRSLQRKDSLKGATQLSLHLVLVAFFAAAQWHSRSASESESASWAWCAFHWGSFIAQCMCMAFLFTAFHELTHRTVFTVPWWNVAWGHLLGFTIFRPYHHYTFYHYNHHKFTGDLAMDPELQDSFIDLKLDNVFSYLAYLSSMPYWIDRLTTLLRHCAMCILPREEKFLTSATSKLVVTEANTYVLLYSLLAFWCYLVPFVGTLVWQLWLLPTLVAQPFLRFYLIAEHHGCTTGDAILSNTRTTSTYSWYRWLAWQMPFHAEHHAFPFVPFHQLKNLHLYLRATVARDGGCTPGGESGYLGVHIGLLKKFL